MTMVRSEVLRVIWQHTTVGGPVTLSGGTSSTVYCNVVGALSGHDGGRVLDYVVRWLRALIPREAVTLAGVDFGGALIVAALSTMYKTIAPVYVRHDQSITGGDLRGRRCFIVDDVATTGGSLLRAVRAVRAAGGYTYNAFVVVDREGGAAKSLADEGVMLRSMAKLREVMDA